MRGAVREWVRDEGLSAAHGFHLVNYPQAFSYDDLINNALYIGTVQGKGLRSPPRWVSVSEIQRGSTDGVTAFYLYLAVGFRTKKRVNGTATVKNHPSDPFPSSAPCHLFALSIRPCST